MHIGCEQGKICKGKIVNREKTKGNMHICCEQGKM
jgi:hypothetical protein